MLLGVHVRLNIARIHTPQATSHCSPKMGSGSLRQPYRKRCFLWSLRAAPNNRQGAQMRGTTPHDNAGPRESTAPRNNTDPRNSAKIVVVSDRIFGGERENTIGQEAAAMLRDAGFTVTDLIVVPEGAEPVRRELERGIADGVALLLTCGGTGLGSRNLTSEETPQGHLHPAGDRGNAGARGGAEEHAQGLDVARSDRSELPGAGRHPGGQRLLVLGR